jgi:hypothetical protein
VFGRKPCPAPVTVPDDEPALELDPELEPGLEFELEQLLFL